MNFQMKFQQPLFLIFTEFHRLISKVYVEKQKTLTNQNMSGTTEKRAVGLETGKRFVCVCWGSGGGGEDWEQ